MRFHSTRSGDIVSGHLKVAVGKKVWMEERPE